MTSSLVIGGTRGLGREVVKLFSKAGHRVSVVGRRLPVDADRDIPNTTYWAADLADAIQLKRALEQAMIGAGKLSYLVFCQRYRGEGDNWQGELDVTLSATRLIVDTLSQHFDPSQDRGIVMVSSVYGDRVGDGQDVGYHVGKAGLNQLMRYYAVNLGRQGIRVNGVTPFTFLKEESKNYYLENQPLHDLYKKIIPLGRMATSADSAQVIAFLCSPQAGFINGQNIYVDGGLSLVWPETIARKLTSL